MGILDILTDDLKKNNIRIIVEEVFGDIGFDASRASSTRGVGDRSRTPGDSKTLNDFYLLVKRAIDDMELRASTPDDHKVAYTEEDPDCESKSEVITFSLVLRQPGAFGQGPPFEGKVKNLKFVPRESIIDKDNPTYRVQINGYYYDNLVRFTAWARTNKEANARALWFEDLMSEYDWWFKLQGMQRVIFWERNTDIVTNVDENKWYGRPMNYFVRTEKLKAFSQKQIEEILIRLSLSQE